jgi:hypothetical protein
VRQDGQEKKARYRGPSTGGHHFAQSSAHNISRTLFFTLINVDATELGADFLATASLPFIDALTGFVQLRSI